jgi:hypothetical protein
MAKIILEDDWSDYDNKKIRDRRDSKNFSCTEQWEIEYLVTKICKHYPQYSKQEVLAVIKQVCTEDIAPHPRDRFVQRVMQILRSKAFFRSLIK